MNNRTTTKVQVMLSRPVALRAWLEDNQIGRIDIANEWNVVPQQVTNAIRRMRCTADQRIILQDNFNIPKILLPDISNGKPGPKPKKAFD